MRNLTVLIVLLLAACSADPRRIEPILKADGCTIVEVGRWSMGCYFSCGRDDAFANDFACRKNNQTVTGCVCSGWFKGYTIRYDGATLPP